MFKNLIQDNDTYIIEEVAKEKKHFAKKHYLDILLSNVYHNILCCYPKWIENGEEKYIHPQVCEVQNYTESERVHNFEFMIGENMYKITSEEWANPTNYDEEQYNNVVLYLNSIKVFGITEKIITGNWNTCYKPSDINIFINDSWVNDFKKIQDHDEKNSDNVDEKNIETREERKARRLKENFGINIPEENNHPIHHHIKIIMSSKMATVVFWSIIVIICLLLIIRKYSF